MPLPLVWLRSSIMVNDALCVAAMLGYGLLVLLCGVVRTRDARLLGEAFRGRARREGATGQGLRS